MWVSDPTDRSPDAATPDRPGADAAPSAADPGAPARIVRVAERRRTRWKNGAGWTAEIARFPDRDDWGWRLSVAEVETAAPFSVFPGIERELVLLSGNGMRLRFDDGHHSELRPPYGSLRFPGERMLSGEPIDGPTTDFNLMWKRSDFEACLWRRPLVGTMVLFAAPGETWVLHLLTGEVRFADAAALDDMAPGDTALLTAAPDAAASGGRSRYALSGSGEALLVHLRDLNVGAR